MRVGKISIITTVYNEEKNIRKFIDSILNQSVMPDELIVVDAESKDNTLKEIEKKIKQLNRKFKTKIIKKKGNRSVGRNEAIKKSTSDIILLTDSGCLLDKNWVKNIIEPFNSKKIDVVAGYYRGLASNSFQKSLIPYVLVMPDKTNKNNFLPATRSMAFRKKVWAEIGGFDESLSHNEDYAFALKIKEKKFNIYFQKSAIVNWIPRKNIKEAFIMFLRFSFGDAESGIFRDKILLIFARYLFFLYLIALFILLRSLWIAILIVILPFLYIVWTIHKNYRYAKEKKSLIIFPIIQITSDVAVLVGTLIGLVKLILKFNYKYFIKTNFILLFVIFIYAISMVYVIKSGIPGLTHPFPYQMDEWHQFQSIKNVFKYGTPNLPGSANGTMFHFFVSGLLLIPFYIFKIIDPFVIKSAVDSLYEQEKIFVLLRLITLFFGGLTLITIFKLAKSLKVNSNLAVLLFFVTPAWLSLSSFFKYDIALVFWISLSLFFLIKYYFLPTLRNFVLGSFFAGVAFSVKVTGLVMLPVIILAYLLFTPYIKKKYLYLLSGLCTFIITSVFLGLPDIIFGGRSMYEYLYQNIISDPKTSENYILGHSFLSYVFLHLLPEIFGRVFYCLSIISIIYLFISSINSFMHRIYSASRLNLFLLLSFFVVVVSFIPLKIFLSANRLIILLPFIVIIDLMFMKSLSGIVKNHTLIKSILQIILIVLLAVQIFESYLWVSLKKLELPQQSASAWIIKNIPPGSIIGLENIPLYQFEPDFVLKEFYLKQYYPNFKSHYSYSIIDENTKNFPEFILISNASFEKKYLKISSKNNLMRKLRERNYKKIANFQLRVPLYNLFDHNFYYPYVGLFSYPESISVLKKNNF